MKKLVALTSVLAAVSLWGTPAHAAGTLVYAAQADAVGLSPILTNDQVSSVATRHMYENLVRRNPETLELEPWLATSWETPDDTTWIFNLREGVTFHDGTPFNAEAVKFTFERIKDPEVAAPRASLLEPVDTIEVVDEYTVRITTDPPYGAFLAALAHTNAAIVSPAAVEEYGDLMRNPVGTGPFMLDEWRSGDRIIMTRYPDYWGEAPSLDSFEIHVIPDVNTQVALLQRGDIDLADSLPPELIGQLQTTAGVNVEVQPGTPVFFLGFNYQNPTWQQPEARQAIASAINTDVIVQLLNPVAQGSCSIIGPQVFGYVEGVEETCTAYDPEAAQELWAQATGGEPRPITLWVPDLGDYPRVGQIVQGQLSQAGFNVEINTVEWGAYLSATSAYEQDLYLLGWSNVTADGSELLYPNLHSDNIDASNRSAYENSQADELINQSRTTSDQEARLELLDQANRLLIEDNAWITLYHGAVLVAQRDTVAGVTVLPNGDWSVANATKE
jgi:peptide/nickel transport system substrate-binding protein